jgi:CheY-like chemotaxis protein
MENKPKIFVVDDDEDALLITSSVLTTGGYAVDTATSGAGALAKIDSVKPALIILDVMMEDSAAGMRVVHALRDSKAPGFHPGYERVPILMLTSVQQQLHVKLEHHAGTKLLDVDKFVDKPIKPRQLLDAVKALLGG